MPRPEVVQMPVRLPVDVRAFVEAQAARNLSTLNSAIITIIRAAMTAEQHREPALREHQERTGRS